MVAGSCRMKSSTSLYSVSWGTREAGMPGRVVRVLLQQKRIPRGRKGLSDSHSGVAPEP